MQKIIVKFKGGSQYEADLKNETLYITEKFVRISPKEGSYEEDITLPVSMVEAIEVC